MATDSGHRYTQTPIRFTDADRERIATLQERYPDELTGEPRTVAEIVRMALMRWVDEQKASKKKS